MDPPTKQLRMEEFDKLRQERGFPCTIQHRVDLEAMLDRNEHLDSLSIPDTTTFGFEVVDFRVQLRGI